MDSEYSKLIWVVILETRAKLETAMVLCSRFFDGFFKLEHDTIAVSNLTQSSSNSTQTSYSCRKVASLGTPNLPNPYDLFIYLFIHYLLLRNKNNTLHTIKTATFTISMLIDVNFHKITCLKWQYKNKI